MIKDFEIIIPQPLKGTKTLDAKALLEIEAYADVFHHAIVMMKDAITNSKEDIPSDPSECSELFGIGVTQIVKVAMEEFKLSHE